MDTPSGRASWGRSVSDSVNLLIGRLPQLQPLDDQLTSLAALDWTASAGKRIVVNAGATGFELAGPDPTLVSYTVATLPSAAAPIRMIYVSNESGGAVPAFNDGTNWRRVTDRAIVT